MKKLERKDIHGPRLYEPMRDDLRKHIIALKRIRPDITIILGGPEVSYEVESQPIVQLADCVITGEADLKFAEVCRQLLAGQRPAIHQHRFLHAPIPPCHGSSHDPGTAQV